ncbi:MAG: membrane protein insertase YidC, partial [Actinobacteria bacterium]|nr:membrane protein insertase YidC [Actinomycetota bacterium]
MDKRFFLALFLSLIVIAISQLLFPPAKPVTPRPTAVAKDSTAALKISASSTQPSVTQAPMAEASVKGTSTAQSAQAVGGMSTQAVAETTTVTTPRAIYKFSNLGAAPVSVVIRDYKNRSANGGLVDMGVPGFPLLSYRLVTATDTADLSRITFKLSRTNSPAGDETLSYDATVKNLGVSISYTVSQDTAASYVIRANGRVTGAQGQAYLVTELPKTLLPTEADTTGDYHSLAYSFKPQKDHARSVLFGSLDPGEKTLEAGPLNWVALKSKYFVFGVLALPNATPFSEVTLTGGPRTSKVATTASAAFVEEVRNGNFSFEIYAGPQESQRLMRLGQDFDHVNPYGWRF